MLFLDNLLNIFKPELILIAISVQLRRHRQQISHTEKGLRQLINKWIKKDY